MFFTLNLENHLFEQWRLQTDATYRKLVRNNNSVQPGDQRFMMAGEFVSYYRPNREAILNGREVVANRTSGLLGEESYSFAGIAHREEKVHIPVEWELVQLLRSGDDNHHNSLVVTLDGRFDFRDPDEVDVVYNPTFAGRNETFAAGNGYVGPKVASMKNYVHDLYVDMLAIWVEHVESGRLNIYDDIGTQESEAALLARLEELNSQWPE